MYRRRRRARRRPIVVLMIINDNARGTSGGMNAWRCVCAVVVVCTKEGVAAFFRRRIIRD